MSLVFAMFILLALVLFALLVWVLRPPRRASFSPDDIFDALSNQRHCSRLPQILQALRPEDTEFLQTRGRSDLRRRLRAQRKEIAGRYLTVLQEDFENLLEASRILAVMSPEVIAMQEVERLKLSLRFAFVCGFVRCKLRLGLSPWHGFSRLADMASGMAGKLETAMSQMGERAAMASEFYSFLKQGGLKQGGTGSV